MADFGAVWLPAGAGNYLIGRAGVTVDRIVCHHTAGFLTPSINQFTTPGTMVSAHFMVAQDGTVYQFVELGDTAFHSGNFAMNQRSVGIEHVSMPPAGGDEFTDLEYDSSRPLIRQIAAQFGFPVDDTHVIPHRNVVQTDCPGALDLARLIAPPPVPPQPKEEAMLVELAAGQTHWIPGLSPASSYALSPQDTGDVHGQFIFYDENGLPYKGSHFDLTGNVANVRGPQETRGVLSALGMTKAGGTAVQNDGPGLLVAVLTP